MRPLRGAGIAVLAAGLAVTASALAAPASGRAAPATGPEPPAVVAEGVEAPLRVAVLPFAARGASPDAWRLASGPLVRALEAAGFAVVRPADVEAAMRARRLRDPALLERFEAAGLAAALGADRLLIGAVDRCEADPAPAVGLTGRLVDPRHLTITALAYVAVDDRDLRRPLGIGGSVTLERTLDEAARRFAADLAAPPRRKGRREDLLRTSILAPDPRVVAPRRLAGTEVRRLVILPFRNRTSRPGAGQTAADAAAWSLARGAPVDLVDAGDATRRLLRRGWRTGLPVGREEILALGREAGVDAVLMGEIDRWEEGRPGPGGAPVVALAVRLLDAATGGILWAAQHERRGDETRLLYEAGNVRLAEVLLARALNEALQPLAAILDDRATGEGADR